MKATVPKATITNQMACLGPNLGSGLEFTGASIAVTNPRLPPSVL